jgi:hypothetical protein
VAPTLGENPQSITQLQCSRKSSGVHQLNHIKNQPSTAWFRLRAYNKMGKGRVARGLAMLPGARRENILYGSSTDEQRSSSGKDRQPGGLFSGEPFGYAPASRLASRPPENSAPIPHFVIGS